jgi:hypothetical protein
VTTIIRIPGLRLTGGGNSREHPMARKRRVAEEHRLVTLHLNARLRRSEIAFPIRVTVTSVSAGTKDRDNASSACKNVIDAVAAWLSLDDGKAERAGVVEWKSGQQRKGPRGFFATEIEIETIATTWTTDEIDAALERARAVPKVARKRKAKAIGVVTSYRKGGGAMSERGERSKWVESLPRLREWVGERPAPTQAEREAWERALAELNRLSRSSRLVRLLTEPRPAPVLRNVRARARGSRSEE